MITGLSKTIYITNRGGTHPNRLLYFDSIEADYQLVDFALPWHGLNKSKWRMLLSGVICALKFPNKSRYKLFVTSDPQLPAILMKRLGLIKKNQKVASYLGSQTLYFIHTNYYSRFTRVFYKFLLKNYDYHICNGHLQAQLLRKVIKIDNSKIFVNSNGVSPEFQEKVNVPVFNPRNINILFVGNLYSPWRLHYKGFDLLLQSFSKIIDEYPHLNLMIAGEYEESIENYISQYLDIESRQNIKLLGKVNDVSKLFEETLLYVHCSRGDALPNSLIEAMYAGIPSITSQLTGNREIVQGIDSKLVTTLEVDSISDALKYYLSLSTDHKTMLSMAFKRNTEHLTQQRAIKDFIQVIDQINVK